MTSDSQTAGDIERRATFHYECQPYGPTYLKDCTWEEYLDRPGVGLVTGTVTGGYSISRLFQYTSRSEHTIGARQEIAYVPLEKFRAGTMLRVAM
jgi:hypothetical protein